MLVRIEPTAKRSAAAERYARDAREHGSPNPDVYGVLDHVPELMRTFHEHWRAIFDSGVVDRDLKELVRRRIAAIQQCATCMGVVVPARNQPSTTLERKLEASFSWRDSELLDHREKAAMWLVDALMGFEDALDDVYAELHRQFSQPEIVELGWFASFNVGTIPFVRSWELSNATSPPPGRLPVASAP
jgi:alkylhydroperoxidase family enzyme